MREHYDFSKMKGKKNPYTKYLKQPVTMCLDKDSVDYFKALAEESGIPYQTLINLYLRDCATKERKLDMKWNWKIITNGCSRANHSLGERLAAEPSVMRQLYLQPVT